MPQKRAIELEQEDPVTERGDGELLIPIRPIFLIRAMCRTFGMEVNMARAFAPLATRVLLEHGLPLPGAAKQPSAEGEAGEAQQRGVALWQGRARAVVALWMVLAVVAFASLFAALSTTDWLRASAFAEANGLRDGWLL